MNESKYGMHGRHCTRAEAAELNAVAAMADRQLAARRAAASVEAMVTRPAVATRRPSPEWMDRHACPEEAALLARVMATTRRPRY